MDFVSFFEGNGTDDKGRTLDQILGYSDHALEHSHNVIQRIFPLEEPSRAQPDSPVIDEDQIVRIKKSKNARINIVKCFIRMMNFYGLAMNFDSPEKVSVTYSKDWDSKRSWLTPRNHNFLRITRIIKSLRLFGFDNLAEAFKERLRDIYKNNPDEIGKYTFKFWEEA